MENLEHEKQPPQLRGWTNYLPLKKNSTRWIQWPLDLCCAFLVYIINHLLRLLSSAAVLTHQFPSVERIRLNEDVETGRLIDLSQYPPEPVPENLTLGQASRERRTEDYGPGWVDPRRYRTDGAKHLM